jgi:hypothetical protein
MEAFWNDLALNQAKPEPQIVPLVRVPEPAKSPDRKKAGHQGEG